jgi:FkbM family methyltransferase
VFGDCLLVYCFEPDAAECSRLNTSAAPNITYIPHALGAKTGLARLYEAKISASSGLYPSNPEFFSRLLNRDNATIVGEQTIPVTTLDEAMQRYGVASVDFLKLDVEGAELDVLLGGERCLRSPSLLGVLSEFRFQEEINGSPVFWQLDRHVRQFGLRLFGMQFTHQSRRTLPYASDGDYRLPNGERFFAYTKHGQIMDGDALYFRDLLIPANRDLRTAANAAQILKAAALFEIYSLNDCAAELIAESRSVLEQHVRCEELLNLLTPPMWGCKVDYQTYVDTYFNPDAPLPLDVMISKTLGNGLLERALRRLMRFAR